MDNCSLVLVVLYTLSLVGRKHISYEKLLISNYLCEKSEVVDKQISRLTISSERRQVRWKKLCEDEFIRACM